MVPVPSSAIPNFYYYCFAAYEPLLTSIGFLGTFLDPVSTHNGQAPWPEEILPYKVLPKATLVTTIQLSHVCALIGLINFCVLSAARKHLHGNLALQEKIVFSLLTPLLIGDIFHIIVTLWALGDQKWEVHNWSPVLLATVVLGLSLMIPRIAWHLGIGRYVDSRDGPRNKLSNHRTVPSSSKS